MEQQANGLFPDVLGHIVEHLWNPVLQLDFLLIMELWESICFF